MHLKYVNIFQTMKPAECSPEKFLDRLCLQLSQ